MENNTSDKNGLVYIAIDKLYAHPENPRKELGDLTELADSIKAKGIMQNLTVVPREEDTYTVIIGHRRLGASKLAGLTALPCVIVEMSPQDQVATMLLENMQRSDLTVYEQAQGFQMMLDLGDTVEGIAEKSGFSPTTVRRRVKLAKLDQEKLKKASARQISIMDLDKLNKIENIEERNKLLSDIGTPNFQNAVKRTLEGQEKAKKEAAWREKLLGAGLVEIKYSDCYGGDYKSCQRNYINFNGGISPEEYERAADEQYFAIGYGSVYLRMDLPEEDTAKAKLEETERIKQNEAHEKLRDAAKRAYELRREFVFSVSEADAKKNFGLIAEMVLRKQWDERGEGGYYMRYVRENFDAEATCYDEIEEQVNTKPYQALLRHAYVLWADNNGNGYVHYSINEPIKNPRLDLIYDFLCKLGYEMSDEEKALQDGTHELYEVDADDEE